MKQTKFSPSEAGCWFDCARGIYIGEAVIDAAVHYGFEYELETNTAETNITEHEHYHEIWDEAEAYLNELAPEGYYFGSTQDGGDWGLWPIEED